MVTIITRGYKEETTCPKCGAVLSYDKREDVETRTTKTFGGNGHMEYIKCAQCEDEIVLKQAR